MPKDNTYLPEVMTGEHPAEKAPETITQQLDRTKEELAEMRGARDELQRLLDMQKRAIQQINDQLTVTISERDTLAKELDLEKERAEHKYKDHHQECLDYEKAIEEAQQEAVELRWTMKVMARVLTQPEQD